MKSRPHRDGGRPAESLPCTPGRRGLGQTPETPAEEDEGLRGGGVSVENMLLPLSTGA